LIFLFFFSRTFVVFKKHLTQNENKLNQKHLTQNENKLNQKHLTQKENKKKTKKH